MSNPNPTARRRVLIVDDEPSLLDVVSRIVAPLNCDVTTSKSISAARRSLAKQPFDLVVTDIGLPDGDGLSFVNALKQSHPMMPAIVITGLPTVDRAAAAMRSGAVDFVSKPIDVDQFTGSVTNALGLQTERVRQQKRIDRLRRAVKKLAASRRQVNMKVDLLCNDLVNAYSELASQMDAVRVQENFRKQIANAADLEQLLCHTMDWLLRQLGPANVGLWLAAENGDFQLGAYMRQDVEGDDEISAALESAVLPPAVQDGFLHARLKDLSTRLPRDQAKRLAGHDFLALSATYLGEPLAAIVFFRTETFSDEAESTLKSIAPVFAAALAGIVRDPESAGGTAVYDDDSDKPDDWWKRGDAPPF